MMRLATTFLVTALTLVSSAIFAAPRGGQGDAARATGPQLVSLSAPEGQERIRITVALVSYPGVPERAACRMKFRAENQSGRRVALSTLLHTFDGSQSDLNSWMVPTGEMAPGATVERLYSCKAASFIRLDQRSDYGWPRSCTVDGERLTPCPMRLDVRFNLPQLDTPKPPVVVVAAKH